MQHKQLNGVRESCYQLPRYLEIRIFLQHNQNEYIDKAMQHAHYEQIEDGTYFGRIPGFKGVWANKPTEQQCREELREVLEGWILLNIADHTPLPIVDGMTLEVGKLV